MAKVVSGKNCGNGNVIAPQKESKKIAKKALVIAKKTSTALEVKGNYEEVEEYLKSIVAKYEKESFTIDNIETVRAIKSEMVSYRTSLTKIERDVKAERFNEPKKAFQEKMRPLYELVDAIESKADETISVIENERIDNVTSVLDVYKAQVAKELNLPEEYSERIEYKKQYYNKGAKDSDTLADMKEQAKALSNEYTMRSNSEMLIKTAIGKYEQISTVDQISKLDVGIPLQDILEFIENEKKRIDNINTPKSELDDIVSNIDSDTVNNDADTDCILVGNPIKSIQDIGFKADNIVNQIDFSSDFIRDNGEALTKKKRIEIEYPVDCGNELSRLFTLLEEFHITVKGIK